MLKEKELELFSRWRKERRYEYFISDGILDEIEWNKQDYKILFVLKEANWKNANEDLCEFLLSEKSSAYWKTWNNVARWTKALIEPGEYPHYVSKSDKSHWLRKIAAINLKKEPITERKYNYFIVNIANKQVPVVSFYHPQIRGNHSKFMKLYEEMIEIGKVLKSK